MAFLCILAMLSLTCRYGLPACESERQNVFDICDAGNLVLHTSLVAIVITFSTLRADIIDISISLIESGSIETRKSGYAI